MTYRDSTHLLPNQLKIKKNGQWVYPQEIRVKTKSNTWVKKEIRSYKKELSNKYWQTIFAGKKTTLSLSKVYNERKIYGTPGLSYQSGECTALEVFPHPNTAGLNDYAIIASFSGGTTHVNYGRVDMLDSNCNVIWSYRSNHGFISGLCMSAYDNCIYCAAGGDGLARNIIKLDRWGKEVAVFSYGDPIYNNTKYFNAIHADDNGYIFVGDEKNNIYKYSTSGKRFWIKQATTDSETEVKRIMDDPTNNKRIIVACGKKLAFIRKSDGEREKEVTLPFYPRWLHSVGKDLYVAGFADVVTKYYDFYKYDLSTDPNMTNPVWKTIIDSPRSIHYDGFGGVFVAFGSYYNSYNSSELLMKLDEATGETIATYNIKNAVFSVISVGWKDIWVGDRNGTIYKLQQI